jgi:hypothetical protein
MQLLLQVREFDTTPQREGNRLYFDAPIGDNWTIARRADNRGSRSAAPINTERAI